MSHCLMDCPHSKEEGGKCCARHCPLCFKEKMKNWNPDWTEWET